jgi:hypothetical protein
MKPLYTQDEFKKVKKNELLPCECYNCKTKFFKSKSEILKVLNGSTQNKLKFCSKKCDDNSKQIETLCSNCHVRITKTLSEFNRNKHHFCSRSCSATYNNTHKTHGIRRSKLEQYLEEQLISLYPNLQLDFNKKDAINSELDIYIPSLKLAFELNGIYHYEPIHGKDKLNKIQNNDRRKFQACAESEISLFVIDTSNMNYFKLASAKKILNIITETINQRT